METKKLKKYYFFIKNDKYIGGYITVMAENKSIATLFAENKLENFDFSFSKKEPLGTHMGTLVQYKEDFYLQNMKPDFNI